MSPNGNRSVLWPADNPAVTAHISLLQGIINRLATSSASCKTWCITLVAALVSLAGATRIPAIVAVALVPVVIFGFLDSMYLAQERAYRVLYGVIVGKVRDGTYSLADAFEAKAPLTPGGCFKAFWSWAVFPLYLGLLSIYVVAQCGGWLRLLARPASG